ncbi:hypothetical protein SSBR45G_23630 [Bradyrhizobium sp. SSBR45G]|nr:hypothetical protein SSBR45G_23630 [Bradyrhizobium sp. SSBR45G]GLH84439.1 hypothetical protein SSBR45R_18990 [Bradyrhizobium sp. SSBR45R]
MVTASLPMGGRFELWSAQFTQVVEAAEQATTTKPASFTTRGAKQLFSRHPPCPPSGQQTRDVTGIGDTLNARRHKVRRCPGQTVQQSLSVGGKKLRTTKAENLHKITP